MKKSIAKKWIKALRSGKYEQGTKALCYEADSIRYCCLGVLCDLYREENGGRWKETAECVTQGRKTINMMSFGGQNECLPEKVRKWAGMKSVVGNYDSRYDSLADRNDEGTSFKRIADIIEKNVGKI